MSNFKCPHCGMINIDCGKDGYKTPKEIIYEGKLKKIKEYCIESLHTIEKHKIYKMCDEYLILCKIKEIIESEK